MRHELRAPDSSWAGQATYVLGRVVLLCGVAFVVGLFAAPQPTWTGFLIGFHVIVGLALAGPMGLAFLHLSGARWSRSLESVPRAMAAALPAAAALGIALLFGVTTLFEWTHAGTGEVDHILEAKHAYLNVPSFSVRLVVFFALWLLATRAIVKSSARGAGDDAASRRRRTRVAAMFLLVFAPTWSLASVDWLQSLDPHWFSSIYALLTLGGMAIAGLAAAVILVAALDVRDEVTPAQYGDFGALLLALAVFWGYIWYSQYLLVWYTNMPEETPWYVSRLDGAWGLLTKLALFLGCVVPFVLLLFRNLRRSRTALVRIAAVILAARLIDLLVLAGPPLMGAEPTVGLWELAPIVGQLALFFLLALKALQRTAAESSTVVPSTLESASHPDRPAGAREPALEQSTA